MNYFPQTEDTMPVLAKTVIGAFDKSIKELCKVAIISKKLNPDNYGALSEIITEVHNLFSGLNSDSTPTECSNVLNIIENIPDEISENFEKLTDAPIKDFCVEFMKLKDQLRLKFTTKSQTWLEMREREKCFLKDYEKLRAELENLQKEVEERRNQKIRLATKRQTQKEVLESIYFSGRDLQSQHPLFTKANTEEQMEFITTINERKLSKFQKDEEQSKIDVKKAILKHRSKIGQIIEESWQSKGFLDWLKEKRANKLKDYEEEQKKLWKDFSDELERCRNLCLQFRDMDKEYEAIVNERRIKEEAKKQVDAAVTLQAFFRGFKVRKELRDNA